VDALAYGYHYQRYRNGQLGTKPKKDDRYDHVVDALRYAIINTYGLADDAISGRSDKVIAKRGRPMYQEI